ncbi:hypothetical protein N2384_11210 [Bacillus paralicheniformis]|uniref:hypothetical protein n=1 Tax=Bacillus paralicheniformis TaxID=1648923 RepID=UPI0021A649F9|nr:hypothetical protein [Bacillus paralicheniformis]UWS63313.1 hypothetical protein N2384_11210 [Bacillus paralicheniformis]
MSNMVEHMTKIFRTLINDSELNRLLYYKDTPLSPDLPDVQDLEGYEVETTVEEDGKVRIIPPIFKTIFKRAPKTDDITESPICRVCMYLGSGLSKPSNQSYMLMDQDLHIDVYTHIETYEENEFRSLKILDRLSALLFNKNIAGFGKASAPKRMLITNPPAGYLGYKMIFTFGAMK